MDDFNDIEVRRFKLDFSTTSLLVEYKTGKGKRFVRRIRFKKYKPDCDPKRVANKLSRQFVDILGRDKVSEEQVLELVKLLLAKQPPATTRIEAAASSSLSPTRKENMAPADPQSPLAKYDALGDLNKVTEEQNLRAKALMDEDFVKNALKPGDEGYVHDKRADFEVSEDNDWDMDSFDDDDMEDF
jgi:hypothetical protein